MMKNMTAIILSLALWGGGALAQEIDIEAVAVAEVTRYVIDCFKQLKQYHLRRALRYVPSVAVYSIKYGIDPLLTATIITPESGWHKNAISSIGAIGLMQVHADRAKSGFDNLVEDPDQQIEAGCKWLRTCIDKCGGDVKQGLTSYATGKGCKAPWSALEYRWGLYEEAVKKFRMKAYEKAKSKYRTN
jgi:soluble lytic murein transglycosylase-like protein